MKINIILALLLLTLSNLCHAFDLETNIWTNFEGTLGKADIQLTLYRFDDGQVKGNYCYKKYESKIQLTGKINGDKIVITESLNGKANGRFEGKLVSDNSDSFEGIWTDNSGTKSIPFKLSLQSVCGINYDHRYTDLYGSDEAIEKFMKQVKQSILTDDKEWIANHVFFPINTRLSKGKQVSIKNKKQFIQNYNLIFHQEFKSKIKSLCVCNMFNNYQGVMLGSGEIWINNTANSTAQKFDFSIISINN